MRRKGKDGKGRMRKDEKEWKGYEKTGGRGGRREMRRDREK